MSRTQNTTSPVQGAGDVNSATIDHVVTQEDLDNNVELVNAGVKVGDTIQIPANDKPEVSADESAVSTPDWVNEILASNKAVIASNNAVIESNNSVVEAIADFRQGASEVVKEIFEAGQKIAAGGQQVAKVEPPKIDPKARYVVKAGKKFVDKYDTSVTYSGGHEVTHLEKDRLQNLLSQGTIEAVKRDESEED